MFGGMGNEPRLPAAPGSWDFPQHCPHCSFPHCLPEAFCGVSSVGPLARLDGSRGNILLGPTSWPRHHSPAWPALPQIGPCCPALLPTKSPLWHWWATGNPDFISGGAGAEDGWAPSTQTKVGSHPGIVLPSSLCLWLREGCAVPWNKTAPVTVFYKPYPGPHPSFLAEAPVPE